MGEKGFTLVEMVVVMGIIAILLTITTLGFRSMSAKASIDSQTKAIYADLMTARSKALFNKQARSVTFTASSISVYSTMDISAPPEMTRTLKHPLQFSGDMRINFGTNGMAVDSSTALAPLPDDPAQAICLSLNDNPGSLDTIVFNASQIKMGKNNGTGCNVANVTTK